MSLSPKSLAAAPEKSPSKICFARGEIEDYKSDCEIIKANNEAMAQELQLAFENQNPNEFYQEKGFVAGHVLVTTLLLFVLVSGK